MARYTGPKAKIARKFREPILGISKALKKKPYGPGQHGQKRKKTSEYGQMLKEKQKAKYTYGILERPFRNLFKKAVAKKGVTGETLLQMLETRLDNIVFRLGLAPTRRAARQLVSHKHIQVNNKMVNIPSYILQQDDTISLRPKSKELPLIKESLEKSNKRYDWLAWDIDKMTGKLLKIPARGAITENINEQSIVELYSK